MLPGLTAVGDWLAGGGVGEGAVAFVPVEPLGSAAAAPPAACAARCAARGVPCQATLVHSLCKPLCPQRHLVPVLPPLAVTPRRRFRKVLALCQSPQR